MWLHEQDYNKISSMKKWSLIKTFLPIDYSYRGEMYRKSWNCLIYNQVDLLDDSKFPPTIFLVAC